MSRLYVAEASYTLTGSNADHHFRLSSAEIAEAVLGLASDLGVGAGDANLAKALVPYAASNRGGRFQKHGKDWIAAIAADLRKNAGASIVVVGERQPAFVQAVAHAINLKLQNVEADGTVAFTATPWGVVPSAEGDLPTSSIADLVASMNKGEVDTLVVLGANPVYAAPADLGFAEAYAKVPHRIHWGQYFDETAKASTWHLPATHPLEEWGDLLAIDGTAAVVQPLVSPLYPDAKSPITLLATLLDLETTEDYEWVRKTWQANNAQPSGTDFEKFWKQSLNDGLVAGTAGKPVAVTLRGDGIATAIEGRERAAPPSASDLELNVRPCPSVFDGSYSNNGWLQEMPNPLDKLTWDNAVLMSPATAAALGVQNDDVVQLHVEGREPVHGPVWMVPGHADFTLTAYLGYGRRLAPECEVAERTGFDVYPLCTTAAPWFARGLTIEKTDRTYRLVTTQNHGALEGRELVRETDVETYRKDQTWTAAGVSPLARTAKAEGKTEGDFLHSLWKERDYTQGYQWALTVDIGSCTGCSACVIACVAENNIPVVGKQQVGNGREMHWVRVDRYFGGRDAHIRDKASAVEKDGEVVGDPEVLHQMVPCMQCENAPCESVCPVGATMHSPEGLNDMAYNRCIGTRYCSNNCPYKVRRFNWFNFHKHLHESEKLAFNPDVTVRSRGVMEKCTYCVQRINAGKFQAKQEGRRVRDGEIVTACQQACPADAIAFGDMIDPEARVTRLMKSDLNYAMLSEFNVKPRTTYLAKVRNPNPELS